MNLVSTITGLPYVGKTTLFNLLTSGHAATGAFAGAEGETNVGVAMVPDQRVDKLSALYKPRKTTYAEVTYRDLGLAPRVATGVGVTVRSDAGQGISAQKLGDLRTSDALVQAEVRTERGGFRGIELRDLRLELGAHADHRHRAVFRRRFAERTQHLCGVGHVVFVDVRDDELRQQREEAVAAHDLALLVVQPNVA